MIRHALRNMIIMIAVFATAATVTVADASAAPVKLVLSTHIKNNLLLPRGVAAAPTDNIYVADTGHNRVQELTPTGAFVLMFGKEVDETTGANICTAISGDKCKEGVQSGVTGALDKDKSVAVDETHVYVEDQNNSRVQEFTLAGEFVLMFGKGVNKTSGGDVCTAAEAASCQAGVEDTVGGKEKSAFRFTPGAGNLLAVNGTTVYVGDEHRVQEFDATTGAWKGEISLTKISSHVETFVRALTIDAKTNNLYLAYGGQEFPADHVYKFDENGLELGSFPVEPQTPGTPLLVEAMAIDSSGRLAVIANEVGLPFGRLYDATTDEQITEIGTPTFVTGAGFNASGELYASAEVGEVLVYKPVPVAEVLVLPAACKQGSVVETSATFECALEGDVNPEGVNGTTTWFQWGATELNNETNKQLIVTSSILEPIERTIVGLRPNETYDYRVLGEDENVVAPEQLSSKTETFKTTVVPPVIVGAPHAAFITAASAVLFGELNPEHDSTEYYFGYGACSENQSAQCAKSPYPLKTAALSAGTYGAIETALEVTNLQPGTTFHYRLDAINSKGESAVAKQEEVFTTDAAPKVQAVTGSAGDVGTTNAVVSGVVDPGGQPATYAFELGVYAGSETQFGTIFTGSVGASASPVEESFVLTDLQPGTQYAYRIAIASGYGHATGATSLFTTIGMPVVLEPPPIAPQLAIPKVRFPSNTSIKKCTRGYTRGKRGVCRKTKGEGRGKGATRKRRHTRKK